MTETILTEFGYKILTANSGQKALAVLARDNAKVDLVITDMVMPGMSGRELVDRIRQVAPVTRILCMSGYVAVAGQAAGHAFSAEAVHERGIAGQSQAGHEFKCGR